MPNLDEHCRQSFIRYGYEFAEIHAWMDNPSLAYGKSHRKFRHDINSTPYEAEKRFRDFVPFEQRENIRYVVIDHIRLDEKNTIQKKVKFLDV
jgi:hypothetical protein